MPGLIRTVRTPEFAGMVFHEVAAKSVLNRVSAASPLPFGWTVNPYRGCSHACTYCMVGDTPILMADGHTRPLSGLRVRDRIYGTVRDGAERRYVVTDVRAHWRTRKPAHRVTLEDGTQLITSADHRLLTERGWQHVAGTRPALTAGATLVGSGRFAAPPKESADYRSGYLCGVVRAGGPPEPYAHPKVRSVYRLRLAAVEYQALARAREYLAAAGVRTDRFLAESPAGSGPDGPPRREILALRLAQAAEVDAVGRIIRWPTAPTDCWRKGFLAGVFDAVGEHHPELRIATDNPEIIDRTVSALRGFGFDAVFEGVTAGVGSVRLWAGLAERLRFLHTVDPAVTRKRSIQGAAIGPNPRLVVSSVEPLGLELPLYDITTGTGDFIADGVVSHNCFARNTHSYLDLDTGADFDSQLVVKVNAAEVLARELRSPKWARQPVAMGTNTDPYQRAEGRYRLMPGIIGALAGSDTPFSVLTKGTLLARDLPLLVDAAQRVQVGLGVSIALVDRELSASVEPGAPSPQARLDLVRRITDAGLRCGVMVAPVLPGLTDGVHQLDELLAEIAAAGASRATVLALHLRPGAREWYRAWLAREHPGLVPRYDRIYGRGSYADRDYRAWLGRRIGPLLRRHRLDGRGGTRAEPGVAASSAPRRMREEPEQLTLM